MKTIMVVDDEVDVLENIKNVLKNDDFEVLTSNNSRDALKIIEDDINDQISLLLIDTLIPGSNKHGLFSLKPESDINVDVTNIEDFLVKPFTREQLINFINKKI